MPAQTRCCNWALRVSNFWTWLSTLRSCCVSPSAFAISRSSASDCCRSDQNHQSVLHSGKKGVLLGLTEAVNFVKKQDRGLLSNVTQPSCVVHYLTNIFDSGSDRRKLHKFPA